MIWVEIILHRLDFVWKLVGNLSNTSLNKSSWKNWEVLSRTDSGPEKD